jgi:orotate phosphoribosyltransferase
VFHYGIFPASVSSLKEIGIDLHGLATWRDVLAVARRDGLFDAKALSEVEAFLDDPEGWQAAHA